MTNCYAYAYDYVYENASSFHVKNTKLIDDIVDYKL